MDFKSSPRGNEQKKKRKNRTLDRIEANRGSRINEQEFIATIMEIRKGKRK